MVIAAYDERHSTIKKQNRILLIQKEAQLEDKTIRTCLNGILCKTATMWPMQRNTFPQQQKRSTSEEMKISFASRFETHQIELFFRNGQPRLIWTNLGLMHCDKRLKKQRILVRPGAVASDAFFLSQIVLKLHTTLGYVLSYNLEGRSKINCLLMCRSKDVWYYGIRHFKH